MHAAHSFSFQNIPQKLIFALPSSTDINNSHGKSGAGQNPTGITSITASWLKDAFCDSRSPPRTPTRLSCVTKKICRSGFEFRLASSCERISIGELHGGSIKQKCLT